MAATTPEQTTEPDQLVRLYWRPGCPYCIFLRVGLHRAGLPMSEVNIWADPAAAGAVRGITGGDETVPTVVVSGIAMVNPSVKEVLRAVRREAPHLLTSERPRRGLRQLFR